MRRHGAIALPIDPHDTGADSAINQESTNRPRRGWHHRVLYTIKDEAEEAKEAVMEAYRFTQGHDWRTTLKIVFQRKYWTWWGILILVVVCSTILSSYHTKIAIAIQPYSRAIRSKGWTWILPTVLLILVSFPPLFGHELIILSVGLIWGLLRGFGIACLGTFLGELVTYYAFKYLLRAKGAKLEATNVTYACIARLMRDGGWKMVTLVRFSAVPGHVTTAIQSTIGLGVGVFSLACVLSLPKQFALVYLGLLLGDTKAPTGANPDPVGDRSGKKHRTVSLVVFLVTALTSAVAAYVIWMRMRRIRGDVSAEIRAKAATQLSASGATHAEGPVLLAEQGVAVENEVSHTESNASAIAASGPSKPTPKWARTDFKPSPYGSTSTAITAQTSTATLPRYSCLPRYRSAILTKDDFFVPPTSSTRPRIESDASLAPLSGISGLPDYSVLPGEQPRTTPGTIARSRSETLISLAGNSYPVGSCINGHDRNGRCGPFAGQSRKSCTTPMGGAKEGRHPGRRLSEPNVMDWYTAGIPEALAEALEPIRVHERRQRQAESPRRRDTESPEGKDADIH